MSFVSGDNLRMVARGINYMIGGLELLVPMPDLWGGGEAGG